jgi:hypothetical protein
MLGEAMSTQLRPTDCLMELLENLRQHRPPCNDADAFGAWTLAMGQVLNAMPLQTRGWVITMLSAELVFVFKGLTIIEAREYVVQWMLQAEWA